MRGISLCVCVALLPEWPARVWRGVCVLDLGVGVVVLKSTYPTILVVSRSCQVDLRFKVDVANQRAALVKLTKAIAKLGRWSGESPSARISATPGSLRAANEG